MKKLFIFTLTTLLVSCVELIGERGNGNRVTRNITVDDFDEIEIAGSFEVSLRNDRSHEVAIEVDENLFDYINCYVRGGTLYLDTERRLDSQDGILVSIPVQEINRLSSSGASEIESKDPLVSRRLRIDMSGAGKLALRMETDETKMDISGASWINLEGVTNFLDIDMSGAGSVEASALETKDCNVQISGVGKVLVNVSGTLNADVSGLGQVEYVGKPEKVKGNVSGVGDVSKSN